MKFIIWRTFKTNPKSNIWGKRMRWTVSLCRSNDDTADTGTTVLAIETQQGTLHTDTFLSTCDRRNKYTYRARARGFPASCVLFNFQNIFIVLKLRNNPLGEAICSSAVQFLCVAVVMFPDTFTRIESNRTDGDEIEYGYPITCGDSRAVLLFKKFVCPGINVRCVKVSLLLIMTIISPPFPLIYMMMSSSVTRLWLFIDFFFLFSSSHQQFNDQLISPKQFVHLAGKATLKDWKRAIRLGGVMLRYDSSQ